MYNDYLVPANTKRSTLIAGFMRPFPDLLIAGVGTIISIIALMITSTVGMWATLLSLVPLLVSWFLVLPIPNYHNTLCVIQSAISFCQKRKKYIWRGWCMKYEDDDKQ